MPNPFTISVRERAVRAYESGHDSYPAVAERFAISARTLRRWVNQWRVVGVLTSRDKGGGWTSPVDLDVMHAVVAEQPDRTTEELTRAYNSRARPAARVHRSSLLRALKRAGYVFKKNARGPQNKIGPTSVPSARSSARGPRT